MGRAIFISYRRDDTEGEAGRLFDDLVGSFGGDSVFMDVSGINPGVDFRKAIDDNVASCGVLLAVIGPRWSSITGPEGTRRLDDPNDFVRLEIASALAREIAVIPVLVHDAKMPRPDDLPENLKNLAFRNSVEITHTRWNSDVKLLTEALGRYVAPTAATDTAPVHATVAVQLPPPTPSAQKSESGHPSNMPLMLGIAAAAVVALGVVGFLVFHGSGNGNNPTPAPVQVPIPAPAPTNAAYLGTWVNPASEGKDGINRLEISASGSNQLTVHAWGKCTPEDCDWGTQTATMDGQQATSNWNLPSTNKKGTRTAAVAIKPLGGELSVTVSNTYSDHAPTQREFMFLKAQ